MTKWVAHLQVKAKTKPISRLQTLAVLNSVWNCSRADTHTRRFACPRPRVSHVHTSKWLSEFIAPNLQRKELTLFFTLWFDGRNELFFFFFLLCVGSDACRCVSMCFLFSNVQMTPLMSLNHHTEPVSPSSLAYKQEVMEAERILLSALLSSASLGHSSETSARRCSSMTNCLSSRRFNQAKVSIPERAYVCLYEWVHVCIVMSHVCFCFVLLLSSSLLVYF